jgi:DNA polymerase-1
MQNLPRSKDYRACFTAGPGNVLIKADYSQIELRVAAELSEDKNMIQAFLDNEDIHTRAACLVTGKDTPDITPNERQLAKSLNFGMIFGLGAKGLAAQVSQGYGIELTEPQAGELIDNYFQAFPGLSEWRSQQGKLTITKTLSGRLRDVSGKRQYTEALNTPIQGTAADGMKLALAELWRTWTPELEGCFPVSCIHDELIVECPSDKAAAAQEWAVSAMKTGMGKLLKHVPVVVDSVVCQSYAGEPAD